MPQEVIDRNLARERWERKAIAWMVLLALVLWANGLFCMSVLLHRNWKDRNECALYAETAQKWWAHQSLYEPLKFNDGFVYLPQSTVIYSPFAAMGHPAGDILWRLLGLLLLTCGIWRLGGLLTTKYQALVFAVASYLALVPSLGSLRNGQPNMHLSGIMMLAAVELTRRRLWPAAILLLVGLAIKPIILVTLLLVMAIYPAIIWRCAIVAALLAVMPYLGQNLHYVNWQYHQFCEKMNVVEAPTRAFCNFKGIFWTFGWIMPYRLYTMLQALAAAGALAMCFIVKQRHREPMRAIFVSALAACYLMLFNPRTEANSYVILEPYLAIPGAMMLYTVLWNRRCAGIVLALMSVLICCDAWLYYATENWLKPITCIVYAALLVREIFRKSSSANPSTGAIPTALVTSA